MKETKRGTAMSNKVKTVIDSVVQENIVFITSAVLLIELAWISLSDSDNKILLTFMRLTGGDIQTIGLMFVLLGLVYVGVILVLSRFKWGKWLMKTLAVALAWVSLYLLAVMMATRG
jgi:hypothetical protein